ncbi:MAG: cytochrome c [Proteobacteria bacterium]|nr:cytochrome c [Pseudomonadota bacterium]
MKHSATLILATALVALGGTALAADAAGAIKDRQANMKGMGKAMKALSETLKTPAPDMVVVKASALTIATNARKVAGGFPKGTGPESGVKTHALPAIWAKSAEFKKHADDLVKASVVLKAAADAGNVDAVRAALPQVGGNCKACHKDFEAKD